MNTYKAYKLRIYPTDFQRELLEKTFGCTRYIYNNFLAERKNKYEESKTRISVYEQLKELEIEIKHEEVINIKKNDKTINVITNNNIFFLITITTSYKDIITIFLFINVI